MGAVSVTGGTVSGTGSAGGLHTGVSATGAAVFGPAGALAGLPGSAWAARRAAAAASAAASAASMAE
jgi:hypothetical protein